MTVEEKNKVRMKYLKGQLQIEDIPALLNAQARQVRWLYKNNNKCTRVYDEKMVRLIVSKLQRKINELELNNSYY